MAETIVENQLCNACGVDVREGALFCYNCGGAVASESIDEEKEQVSDVWLRENIVENGKNDTITKQPKEELKEFTTAKKITDKPISKPGIQDEAKLKSAASMRKKSATFQKKQVEVVWKESDDAPNGWFIIVAIILTLFAVVVFFLAMYLK